MSIISISLGSTPSSTRPARTTFRWTAKLSVSLCAKQSGICPNNSSTILKARTGSTHGYDVTDPAEINPEIGTPEEFNQFVEALHAHGMGLILDIVPNHMAASMDNPWWFDVLEKGQDSPYASFFDV